MYAQLRKGKGRNLKRQEIAGKEGGKTGTANPSSRGEKPIPRAIKIGRIHHRVRRRKKKALTQIDVVPAEEEPKMHTRRNREKGGTFTSLQT